VGDIKADEGMITFSEAFGRGYYLKRENDIPMIENPISQPKNFEVITDACEFPDMVLKKTMPILA
jgi:hypothetical protein